MSDQEKSIKKLNELLEKSYDAKKGYTEAIDDIKDPALQNYFREKAAKRTAFAGELSNEIRTLGGEPKTSGSTAGNLHRVWMDLKSSISGNSEEAILKECIRGDKKSLENYNEVLENEHVAESSKTIVRKEKTNIEETLARIKTMEDVRENYSY
ncbi:MAG TPA: PA2169 family four-helix-bundle protein [Salinimicrobium sp.]|nr:PA2169 family four-helix-bundle protein [Salinimicrobium sp.]